MSHQNAIFCRTKFLIPLSEKDRSKRIEDGFILTSGEEILKVGEYSSEIGAAILKEYGKNLKVLGFNGDTGKMKEQDIPCLNSVMLPAFVKAHGHDHEQPLIGIAKDVPLTEWLDKAVNPFTGYINEHHASLVKELGMSPQLVTYLMARVCDINYGITSSMVHHCNYSKYHAAEIVK